MKIIKRIEKFRKKLLKRHIEKKEIPNILDGPTIRKHLIFKGKVQRVGFRVEADTMASRLGLVGWVRNLDNGDVEIEVEGNENKLDYLIEYLSSIKRAPITSVKNQDIDVLNQEKEFKIIK